MHLCLGAILILVFSNPQEAWSAPTHAGFDIDGVVVAQAPPPSSKRASQDRDLIKVQRANGAIEFYRVLPGIRQAVAYCLSLGMKVSFYTADSDIVRNEAILNAIALDRDSTRTFIRIATKILSAKDMVTAFPSLGETQGLSIVPFTEILHETASGRWKDLSKIEEDPSNVVFFDDHPEARLKSQSPSWIDVPPAHNGGIYAAIGVLISAMDIERDRNVPFQQALGTLLNKDRRIPYDAIKALTDRGIEVMHALPLTDCFLGEVSKISKRRPKNLKKSKDALLPD